MDSLFRQVYGPDLNPGNGSGWMPFGRMEWFYGQRAFPSGNIPAAARIQAWEQKARMPQALDENWTSYGPTTMAGRALSIAWHPTSTNTVYIGSASGGLWKSTNSGGSWYPLTDQLPSLAVGAIALDPTNPNTVYIGTGEGAFNTDAVYGAGIFKSTDGGTSWNITGMSWEQFEGRAVNKIVVHPTNSQILWAATSIANGGGVFKSTDGGANWTLYLAGDARDLAVRADSVNILYAALGYPWGGDENGIYRSTNGGNTWTALGGGLPSGFQMGRIALSLSRSNSTTMYAGISQTLPAGAGLLGIYKSTNSGATWTLQASSPNMYGGQGWYDLVCEVHPTNPAIVYSNGIDCYKSTDSGLSWTQKSFGTYPPGNSLYAHSDHHALAFKPGDPNTILAATDGGMFKSTNGGDTWIAQNAGLTTFQFYSVGSDLQNSYVFFGGAQDNGTVKYSGGWISVQGGDGGYCNVDYLNNNTVYAERQRGLHYKSTDGGVSFGAIQSGISGSGSWVTPVVMDPVDPAVLYTATSQLYKSTNGGTSWNPVSPMLNANYISTIAVAPTNSQVIYIGYENGGLVWSSTDGGANWQSVSAGLPMATVTRVAVSPVSPNTVYATFSSYGIPHVWKSTNGGTSWNDITANLPDVPSNVIVVNPISPETLYLGTDLGVYSSTDGGATWSDYSSGLPNVVVDDLSFHSGTGALRAATHGRGMWQTGTSTPALAVLSPNGGETWVSGNTETIVWATGGLGGNVSIELSRSYPGGSWETVISSTANDGSYSWAVSGSSATHARVRITSVETPTASDVSNSDFRIDPQGIELLSPNGGEAWPVGLPQTISWIAHGDNSVTVQINRSYPSSSWVTLTTTTYQSYTWTVTSPSSVNTRVRVYQTANPSVSDTSNSNFALTNPSVAVIYPNGGETLIPGSVQTLRWRGTDLTGTVRVEICRAYPSGVWDTLAVATSADSLVWTVYGNGTTSARLRVTSISNPAVTDVSDANFTIRIPSLALSVPNGGEVWEAGTTHAVRWTRSNLLGPVNLYINRNYPANEWTLLAVGMNADSFSWPVTPPYSNTAKVRVSSVNVPALTDESNGTFTIGTGIVLTSPHGGEAWDAGTTQTITWSRFNAPGAVTLQLNRNYPGGGWETLNASVTANSYPWLVSGSPAPAARIRVFLNSAPAIGDTTPFNFVINAPDLVLTAPNGGDVWPTGSQQTVTWSRNNATGNVTVQLNRTYPTGTWETLITTASGNSFPWTVNAPASSNARVRIFLTATPATGDTSAADFTIAAPGMTILVPNGGEQWALGAPQTISFARVNADGAATVQVKRNYPSGSWETISSNLTASSISWTPSGIASSACRVKVYLNSTPTIADTSNANFALVSPVLTVTSPNGGELWGLGSTANITFTRSSAFGPVTVSLNRNYPAGAWETLSDTVSSNSYPWVVSGAVSSAARIRVTLNSVPTVLDESNGNFSIVQPSLNLTAPDGGLTYTLGAALTVRWSRAAAPGAVSVLLNRTYPTGAWELLTSSVTADTFRWTSSGTPSTTCRMKVRLTADSTVYDVSASNFTLQSRTLTLTAPNGGEAFYTGSPTTVSFVRNNASTNVTIQLNRSYPSSNWETLATTVSGSTFTWNVNGAATNSARLRIFLTAEPQIGDTSNGNFVIVIPTISLVSPNGGEQWSAGSAQNITWQRSGVWDNVRLEIKRNYPSGTWEQIATSLPGNTYAWVVTGPGTTNARLRVISTVNSAYADTSNAAFSITSSQITLLSPNGGENVIIGAPLTVRWSRSMASGDARVMLCRNYPLGAWEILGTTTADSLVWIATSPASVSARVRVYLLSDLTVADTSASNFTLTQPSVSLIAPNGGEVLRAGGNTWIYWTRTGVDSIDLLLNRNYPNGAWEPIAAGVNANQYAWAVTSPASTTCRIKVQAHTNAAVNDISAANFEIQQPQITLTEPAPGDTFAVGVANVIQWTRNATATDTVRVQLNTNYPSGSWVTLDSTAASEISWIAQTAPTTTARVRVVSVSTPAVSDTLSGNFSILPMHLTITAPSAGTIFTAGNPMNVSWTRDNVVAGASVYLSRDGMNGPWEPLALNIAADSWTGTLNGPRSTNASVRVVSTHIPALSDTVLSLQIREPALTVLSPNGGVLGVSNTEVLRWARTDFSGQVSVDINYAYPSGVWHLLGSNLSTDSLAWIVPDSLTTHARVRVRSASPAVEDVSDSDVTISNPHLFVVSPNGGDSLVIDQSYTVRWSRAGAQGAVRVEWNSTYPSVAWAALIDSTLADSFVWTVPSTLTSHARVRVSLRANSAVRDTSDSDFQILMPALTLLSPVAGDSIALTLPVQFSWTGAGSSLGMNIYVKRNYPSGSWETLASNISGTSWTWTAAGAASENARFRILCAQNLSAGDTTDGVVRIGQPQFVFTQPQSADTFVAGEQTSLSWTRRFITGSVRVELSRQGTGGPWEQIGTADGNSIPWTVSTPISNIVRFRLTSLNASWVAGMTPFNCTIVAPALSFTSPSGGGVDTVGSSLELAWQWTNTSGAVRLEVSRDSLNGTWQTLADSITLTHFTFAVTEPETDSLRFRVTSRANPAVFALSPVRRVVLARSIQLFTDNSGPWYIGQQKWVHWSRSNWSGSVRLEMTNLDRSQPWTPLAQVGGDSFLWNVTGPEADLVALRVSSLQRPEIMDTTDTPISIRQPYIDILEPNGGDTLVIGQDIRLRWIGVGFSGGVAIGLWRGEPVNELDTLFYPTPNDSSQIWHIAGPAAQHCMLVIVAVNDTMIFDTSTTRFTIVPPLAASPMLVHAPLEFALTAPYPNPFNSTSTIEFALPHAGRVTVVIYDLLGREVAVLANEHRTAGVHRVQWNARNAATGMYFVRMTSGDFVATRRLHLIK